MLEEILNNDGDIIATGLAPDSAPAPIDYGILPTDDAYTAFIKRYRHDPVGFAINVIGFVPQEWQAELFEAVANGTRQISIRAGHGVGKTSGVAVLCIWMLVCGHNGDFKCVVSAPTQTTLKDGLFAEIVKWMLRCPDAIQALFTMQSERVYLTASPATVFLTARVAGINTPEALQGIHADKVLLIIDEASGVPDAVFRSAGGSMSTDGSQTILISNPTRNSGYFYDTHHGLASIWHTMHVSCEGNPRVSEDFRKEFIYGETDPQFQIRFLGNFPTQDENTLISADLVDAAMKRDIAVDPQADLIYGLDVARFGADSSCLVKRRANVMISMTTWKGIDTMTLVGNVMAHARADNPTYICVDSIGIGSGVADRLRELGQPVRDVNVAESAAMNENCSRLRDELWVQVRDWLALRGCRLVEDKQLRQELVTPRLEYLSNGKMRVESKDSIKQRSKGASPDHADALCLTFAGMAAGVGGSSPRWIKGQSLKRNLRATV